MSDWLSNDWCSTFMLALGHFLWQGTLIAVAPAIVMRAASSSTVRYRGALSALLLMAACPVITFVSLTRLPSLAAVGREVPETGSQTLSYNPVAGTPDTAQAADVVNTPLESPTKLPPNMPLLASVSPTEKSVWERIAPLLTSLYLSGVVLLLFRLAIGLWGGRALRAQATPVTESYLLAALQRQAAALGLKLRPALAYCEHVTVPTVMGIFRPMILLPLSLTSGLTPDQFESILAHELAHLRRFDHLANLLQRIIESLLFFHPAVWWISNRVRVEREHCCDDLVVACGAVPFDYAASLLRVAELSRPSSLRPSVAAVSLLATGSKVSSLRHRIARLLGESAAPPLRLNPRVMVFAIIGPLIFVIVALQSNASNPNPASDDELKQAVGVSATDAIETETAVLLRLIPEADVIQRVDAILTLAKTKDKGGNREAAMKLLALATKIAFEMSVDGKEQNGIPRSWLQSAALMQICSTTLLFNDTSVALQLATRIESPHSRVVAMCQIAEQQAQANDSIAARETLETALAAAKQTPDTPQELASIYDDSRQVPRQMAFEHIVESFAKLGETDAAFKAIDEMEKSVEPSLCSNALLKLLTAQVVADNDDGRDRVLAKIIELDEASRVEPDKQVMAPATEFLNDAYIAAAEELMKRKELERADKLISVLQRSESREDDSWEIDALITRRAIHGIKDGATDFVPPTEQRFTHRVSFLKFNALFGRELARQGQDEKAIGVLDAVVSESRKLNSTSLAAIPMIFAAQAYATLGDDPKALATADSINPTPSIYVTSSDWDFYGLPFQAMSCQATALSLIAKAQLERNDADAASNTLRKIVIETSADGKAASWYLERVKADALADVANWLSHHGRQNEVINLIDSAETRAMRVTVLSRLEHAHETLAGIDSFLKPNARPNIQPLTFAELEQLVKSLGGNCHGSKQGTILAATVQIRGEKIDDAVIRKLASYPHLEILRLYDDVSVTDEGLSALQECSDLFILELSAPAVTDIGMKSLARMPKLEYLTLSGTKVTDAGLQHLIDAPALTFFNVSSPLVSDAGLTHVAQMKKLEDFDCFCSKVTDEGLKAIAESTSLTSVSIANGRFSDRGIEFLSKLKGLSRVTVYGAPLTDESLRSLGTCANLKSLSLSECNVTDAGLKHLSSLSMLHGLHLKDGHSVSGSGLADLKSLPLRELSLAGSSVTNETIRQLREFPEIQHLYVGSGTMAPDDGQSYGLTDEGLQHLKELKNLTHLTFDGAAISDAGVLTIAQPHLKYIQCLRCPLLTLEGVKAWRAASPGFQIMASDWNANRERSK